MKHTDIKNIITSQEYVGKTVTVCGWVRTSRNSKSVAFVELNDGTSLKNIQVVVEKGDSDFKEPRVGMAVKVEGIVVAGRNNTVEINITPDALTVLGDAPTDYPLQKKGHTLEFLRTIPHLRGRTNTFNAVWRVRSVLAAAIHRYFQEHNYVYVNTPLITGSDCEGAGEMFQVTTNGFTTEYKTEEEYYANDFFGKRAGLSVSGQLEGEMAATAMGKIYTFGPSFRAENSNTPKHLAEFWHIEPEVAFMELDDVIELAEDMLKYVIGDLLQKCPDEVAFFDAHFEKGLKARLEELISHEFGRVTYTEAIELLKKSGENFVYPVEWGCDLQTEHERYLSEKVFKKAVFVTDYPKEIKSFYMKQNPDGKTVAAVDLLVPGVGEIIGGSEREADYDKLIAAMEERGMSMEPYADYLDLRKYGTVPHGGFGLGFERLIMYTTGMANIRDVILFPRTVGSIR
ncbi:MAG: asparagine--tRNA ligase [Ruminococcus sp.]|uniref:asparagine--tRNA ligase n=1 Tax=uncultured Ruminococcus sp. TaxID=165186 RepID=UPI001568ACE3|nr:asparagine--tRNA ligase [uncultured Ruminococcus sp.]MCR4862312.1 asparagine--tRNA ligase [Ruminococcus sp.]